MKSTRRITVTKFYISGTAQQIEACDDFIGVAPELLLALRNLGYRRADCNDAELYIALNHDLTAFEKVSKRSNFKKKVLIRIEPDVVHPIQYRSEIEKMYDLVITPGGVLHSQTKFLNYPNPYRPSANHLRPSKRDLSLTEFLQIQSNRETLNYSSWINRPYDTVFIGSNKVSAIKSNYSKRQHLVLRSDKLGIDVFGSGWNMNFFSRFAESVRVGKYSLAARTVPQISSLFSGIFFRFPKTFGFGENKLQILERYRYNIIIENSQNIFTEKLIDSLVTGAIPIYDGPNPNPFGIPEDIILRFDGSPSGALESMLNVDSRKLKEIKQYSSQYVMSREFISTFAAEQVYGSIAKSIDKLMQTR
jgi:hypothetical protein